MAAAGSWAEVPGSCSTLLIGCLRRLFQDVRQPPEAARGGRGAFVVLLGLGSGADNSLEANTATVTMTFDAVSRSSTSSHS